MCRWRSDPFSLEGWHPTNINEHRIEIMSFLYIGKQKPADWDLRRNRLLGTFPDYYSNHPYIPFIVHPIVHYTLYLFYDSLTFFGTEPCQPLYHHWSTTHDHEIGRGLLGSVHEVNLAKLLGCWQTLSSKWFYHEEECHLFNCYCPIWDFVSYDIYNYTQIQSKILRPNWIFCIIYYRNSHSTLKMSHLPCDGLCEDI